MTTLLELFFKGNSSTVPTALSVTLWTVGMIHHRTMAGMFRVFWCTVQVRASPKLSHGPVGAVGTLELFPSDYNSIRVVLQREQVQGSNCVKCPSLNCWNDTPQNNGWNVPSVLVHSASEGKPQVVAWPSGCSRDFGTVPFRWQPCSWIPHKRFLVKLRYCEALQGNNNFFEICYL
jgi:hypothetical protein